MRASSSSPRAQGSPQTDARSQAEGQPSEGLQLLGNLGRWPSVQSWLYTRLTAAVDPRIRRWSTGLLTPFSVPLQLRGPLPERQVAMLVYEVLRVVRCCHSALILHGDIKVRFRV